MKQEWMDKIIDTDKEIIVTIIKENVYDELYNICGRVHSSCDSECPVFERALSDEEFDINKSNSCPYFKNGKSMFERLQGKRLTKIKVNGKTKIVDFEIANKILNMDCV